MKLSTLTRLTSILIIVLTLLSFGSLFLFYQSMGERTKAITETMELGELSDTLIDTSNFLSTQVRSYAQFGEKEYLDLYNKEINETQTRENVMKRLKELKIPADLFLLVSKAKAESDALAVLEARAIKAVEGNQFDQARELVFGDQYKAGKEQITEYLDEFNERLTAFAQGHMDDTYKQMIKNLIVVVTVIAILSVSAIASFVTLQVKMRPLQNVTEVADRVAEGDLTIKPIPYKSTKDEIGHLSAAINKMVVNLQALVKQVQMSSEQVAASAEELSASSEQSSRATEEVTTTIQELAAGAEHQVHNVLETQGVIGQIQSSIIQISANSESSIQTSNIATEKAQEGNEAIAVSVKQMNSINESVNGLAEVIRGLGESSKEIGQIVTVITGIADQTNLLALNAAIEAARAGEQGKGFAVVADEVRKLAEQSSQSAQQISNLIAKIQEETDRAVYSMEATNSEVKDGINLVHTAGESFKQINESILDVTENIKEVNSAILNMSEAVEKVVNSAELVKEVANQAAFGTQNVSAASEEQLASMEEITASSQSLSQLADELQGQIGKFKL